MGKYIYSQSSGDYSAQNITIKAEAELSDCILVEVQAMDYN